MSINPIEYLLQINSIDVQFPEYLYQCIHSFTYMRNNRGIDPCGTPHTIFLKELLLSSIDTNCFLSDK